MAVLQIGEAFDVGNLLATAARIWNDPAVQERENVPVCLKEERASHISKLCRGCHVRCCVSISRPIRGLPVMSPEVFKCA